MRYLLILLAITSSICAADSYPNSKMRTPVGSYSQSLGGISVLPDAQSPMYNPSYTVAKRKVSLFGSTLTNNREEVGANFTSGVKNRLGVNVSYLYRGERNIDIYNNDEVLEMTTSDVSHFVNVGASYVIFRTKKKGSLTAGVGLLISKEYVMDNIETENPIKGLSLGTTYKKNDLELAASLLNIGAKNDWASSTTKNDEVIKDIRTDDIPIKGIVAAKYTFIDQYSILAQTDLEDTDTDRFNAIIRGGLMANFNPVWLYGGYGDESAGLGLEYKRNIAKTLLGIHLSSNYSLKSEEFTFGLTTSLEF